MQIHVQLPDNRTISLGISDMQTNIIWVKQSIFVYHSTHTYNCYFEYQKVNQHSGTSDVHVLDEGCDHKTLQELGITKETKLILKQYDRNYRQDLWRRIEELEKENLELKAELTKCQLVQQTQPKIVKLQEQQNQHQSQSLQPINLRGQLSQIVKLQQKPSIILIPQTTHNPMIEQKQFLPQPNFSEQDFILKCNQVSHKNQDITTICLHKLCQSPLLCAECNISHSHDRSHHITRNRLSQYLINLEDELIELGNLQKNISQILSKGQFQCRIVENLISNVNQLRCPNGYIKLQELIQNIVPHFIFNQQSSYFKFNGDITEQLSRISKDIEVLFQKP